MMTTITSALLTLPLLHAAVTDISARWISNTACGVVAAAGMAGRLVAGAECVAESAISALILFALLLAVYRAGKVGGGDVKLLTALSLGLSVAGLMQAMVVMSLIGVALAAAHLALRRLPSPHVPPSGASLPRRLCAIERWRSRHGAPLPYGVAIACGGIWVHLSTGA